MYHREATRKCFGTTSKIESGISTSGNTEGHQSRERQDQNFLKEHLPKTLNRPYFVSMTFKNRNLLKTENYVSKTSMTSTLSPRYLTISSLSTLSLQKNLKRKKKFPPDGRVPGLDSSDQSLREFLNDVSKYIRNIYMSLKRLFSNYCLPLTVGLAHGHPLLCVCLSLSLSSSLPSCFPISLFSSP